MPAAGSAEHALKWCGGFGACPLHGPLRPIGAARMAEAQWGRTTLQSLQQMSRGCAHPPRDGEALAFATIGVV